MNIEVYKNLELMDMIFSFDKLESSIKFCGYGTFRLITKEYIDLSADDILMINGRAFLVEDIYKYKSISNITKYEIVGKCLNSLLERRVLTGKYTSQTGAVIETELRNLLTNAFISPGDRNIPEFELGNQLSITDTFGEVKEYNNMTVGRFLTEILGLIGIGYRIDFDAKRKKFVFRLLKGNDKSSQVFFSEEYDNLSDCELSVLSSSAVNVAYHEGVASGVSQGLRRREGYEIHPIETKIEGKILQTEQYSYKEDWNLGDIVLISDKQVGFKAKKRIVEIKEFYSERYDMEVVFGGD